MRNNRWPINHLEPRPESPCTSNFCTSRSCQSSQSIQWSLQLQPHPHGFPTPSQSCHCSWTLVQSYFSGATQDIWFLGLWLHRMGNSLSLYYPTTTAYAILHHRLLSGCGQHPSPPPSPRRGDKQCPQRNMELVFPSNQERQWAQWSPKRERRGHCLEREVSPQVNKKFRVVQLTYLLMTIVLWGNSSRQCTAS